MTKSTYDFENDFIILKPLNIHVHIDNYLII